MKGWGYKVLTISYLLFLLKALPSFACVRIISPMDYGLANAKTSVERYHALLATHLEAYKQNCGVSYKGIKNIDIEIPANAQIIPLTDYTDFAGVIINVTNNSKDEFFLFFKESGFKEIALTKKQLTSMRFDKVPKICDGTILLVVEDQKPWVSKRIGYNYGVTRRDIVLLKNGSPQNSIIQPYSNDVSEPKFRYCRSSSKQKVIKNLIFNRTKESTCKTFFVKVVGQNNVIIENVTINTPENNVLYGDYAMSVQNCTNIRMRDITINGTYSQKGRYGYGINLNNVYNSRFVRIKAQANWGIFGSYNVNTAYVEKSDINRFDVHCYGRDICFKNTVFRDLYNQFSSVYGKVVFNNCVFHDFTPVLIESSFNAYTFFDLICNDCTFHFSNKHNCIVDLLGPPKEYNERFELKRKSLPNIYLINCTVNLSDGLEKWFLIKTGNIKYEDSFDGITNITTKRMKIESEKNKEFVVFSEPVRTTNKLETNIIQ